MINTIIIQHIQSIIFNVDGISNIILDILTIFYKNICKICIYNLYI